MDTATISRTDLINIIFSVWILVWNSMTTVAQALSDVSKIADNIGVYSIGSGNTLNDLKSREYVFLFKICDQSGI